MPYKKLPTDLLTGFYFEIQKNIKNGILSENMFSELELIKAAATNRGITLSELHEIYNSKTKHQINNTNMKGKRIIWGSYRRNKDGNLSKTIPFFSFKPYK